jgi:amino acid adenylation domain-containing protein
LSHRSNFTSLLELLHYRAEHEPDQRAYTLLVDGETEGPSLTYGQLDQLAQVLAARLQSLDASGERVLLLYPTCLEYIVAFFGCIYAGAIAVPAFPPRYNRSSPRIQAMASDSQASFALTTHAILERLGPRLNHNPELTDVRWIGTSIFDPIPDEITWDPPNLSPDSIAYLQYTSGSTSSPKGVLIPHGNLMLHLEQMQEIGGASPGDPVVSYLPLYHDLGLVAGVLSPLHVGMPLYLMPPTAFVQKPARWLQAITRYKAKFSGAPAFAYQYCADQISPEDKKTLDLSSWKVSLCGAETIPANSLKSFIDTFTPCGLDAHTVLPGYGLAEAILMVSTNSRSSAYLVRNLQLRALEQGQVLETDRGDETSRQIVSCGRAPSGLEILIVDPETLMPCPTNQIGEVWVSGPSLAQGYWNRPEETVKTFQASLAGEDQGKYLRTGDLGYLLEGELYITGRLKELIIIRGANYYPQDIELTVQHSHAAIQPHGCIAFSTPIDGEEKLVIATELKRTHRNTDISEVSQAIRRAVAEEHELPVNTVAVTKLGAIPRTSSGKLQRNLGRSLFLRNQLELIGVNSLEDLADDQKSDYTGTFVAPLSSTEVSLSKIWEDLLGLPQISIYDNFFELGGNSLMATQAVTHARQEFNVKLPVNSIYEAPTIAGLSMQIDAAARIGDALPSLPPISTVDRDAPLPLSFAQERMWFIHQLDPGSSAYHVPVGLHLSGPFDLEAMDKSAREVFRRHEILRTTFPDIDGQPRQVIAPPTGPNIQFVDLRRNDEYPMRWNRAMELAEQLVRKPFDLTQGPLIRFHLIQIDDQEHLFVINLHHIISDAWSLGLLAREVLTLYSAYAVGDTPSLPKPPIQYADYAVWQRDWLQGDVLEDHLSYWKKQTAALAHLELPTDFPRPVMQTYRGAILEQQLSPELIERLEHFSHQMGGTPFMTLFAVFNTLLHRYTDQTDIAVLVPIANRNQLAAEQLVGTLVNTLLMRTDFSGDPTFRELFERQRAAALEAYQHQDLPFAKLIASLQPERDTSYAPYSQVMFNLINTPSPILEFENLKANAFEIDRGAAQFDLLFGVTNTPAFKAAKIEYNTDLFEAETISLMMDHFLRLLEAVQEDPDRRLSQIQMLGDDERRQILEAWNDTSTAYADQATLEQLFEAQAARDPTALAFISEGQTMSYLNLNQGANRLAHYLSSLGIGPESIVGVFLERSLDLPIGLLGILKAGAAYLPLDPNDPLERLNFILNDARVPLILTQENLRSRLGEQDRQVICLDTDQDLISGQPATSIPSQGTADSLAYVLYTSGSTGEPKGVESLHRGAVNRFAWMWENYPFQDGEVCCQKTALSFVDSVWELFGPLLQGVPNVIIPDHAVRDPNQLVTLLDEHHVTRLVLVPSLLSAILDAHADLDERVPDLRLWVCSGEVLPIDLVQRFQQAVPHATLLNLYGSSEVAADVTFFDTAQLKSEYASVPLGRPIANTSIHLLDSHMNPVPVGVPGEIHVGGAGLARGYHRRPDLTIQKFVRDPFSKDSQARLFKTGDIGRYLPDGNIEFLGRRDFQVNLRGYRIELLEIEVILCQHKAVRQAAVLLIEYSRPDVVSAMRSNTPNGYLAAYILADKTNRPSVSELRDFLKAKLPAYMLPSYFYFLESMPLTPSGKIDRLTLRELDSVLQAERVTTSSHPQDEIDKQLIQIWEQILGIHPIGMQDDFFDLGGHSLLAVQLFAKIDQELGIRLPVGTIFQATTIEQLGKVIRQQDELPDWSRLIPIQVGSPEKPPLFIVHGFGGGVLEYAKLARLLDPEQPVYGLQARGVNNSNAPHSRVEDMAAYYIKAMRSLQPHGPYHVSGYSFGGVIAYEIARQLHEMGEQVGFLANLVGYAPLREVPSWKIWHPGNIPKFLTNLVYWLNDEWSRPERTDQWARYRAKAKIFWQGLFSRGEGIEFRSLIQNIVGETTEYPAQILELMEAHLQAERSYQPLTFPGRMTLFRVRALSFWRWYDPQMGWGDLAIQGIDVKIVSGAHYNILEMPHVEILAKELKKSLNRALNPETEAGQE